jgi:HEAT repeat protein
MRLLEVAAATLIVLNVACLVTIAISRLRLVRRERRQGILRQRLEPLALALVADDAVLPSRLKSEEAAVLADLMGRYGNRLSGDARDRVATYFERVGAVDHELSALASRRSWRRATAAFSLGDMGSPRAANRLVAALRDREPDVRAAAAGSLGRLRVEAAVESLVEALATRQVPRAVIGRALVAIGPAAAHRLTGLLEHPDAAEREAAVQLLGLVAGAEHMPLLLARLNDTSAGVRAQAARALGRLGEGSAAAALVGRLRDRIPFVRAAAAEALGLLGERVAVPGLLAQAAWDVHAPAVAAARAVALLDRGRLLEASTRTDVPAALAEAADLAELG